MFARRLACGAAAAALMLGAAPAVYAQVTTGGVTGRVTNANGQPVANATVVVRHVPSGTSTTTVTNGTGQYSVSNQRVGGPYTVTVTAPNYQQSVVDIAAVGIGDATSADVTLAPTGGGHAVTEVVVTGVRVKNNMGPQSRITLNDVQTLPSFSRDIKDYVRSSPYVTLDPTNNNALIIGGQNNRANSILIDGVKQTDDFGLNANGYPTQRMPISLSVVQALNVDVAPYDAQYDGFQGGVVNVVTKSGGNDFHGEIFYEGDNQKLRGQKYYDSSNTLRFFPTPFSEQTYGLTLTGPLIPDRLFFTFSYEKYESNQPSSFGPFDTPAANKINGVTDAEASQVRSIIQSHYGYDPLSYNATSLPIIDRKYFGKLDWNINDQHRAVVEFQSTKGASQNSTGDSQSASSPSLSLLSKWYNLETDLTVYTAQLFSHWTDNFSTTLMYSHKDVLNNSLPLGGNSFAQFQVFMPGTTYAANGSAVCNSATPCPSIFLGPDISRMANSLKNTSNLARFKADYRWGNHTITAGVDLEKIDIFNLFVQNANGTYVFNSINDLQNGNAFSIKYQSAADNVKADGAARFSFTQNAAYLQDEWAITPELTARFGVREEWYTSGDRPKNNTLFQAAYGYASNKNLDGLQVFEPRLGVSWKPDPTLQVYGGAGLFQGGTPNVWISNSYSNPGNLIGTTTFQCTGWTAGGGPTGCNSDLVNVNGFHVGPNSQAANTASANLGTGNVNALAPGFEPASIWKESIGVKKDFDLDHWRLGSNWHAGVDLLNSQVNNALYWQDVYQAAYDCTVIGSALCGGNTVAPDGRPEYGKNLPGVATLFGSNARLNRTDVVFFNTHKGYERQATVWLEKDFREGIFDGLKVNYAYTAMDAKDVNPGTSSVATSNFRQVAVTDFNNPALANSNYLIKWSEKLTIEYDHKWFGDNLTRIGVFTQIRSGLPYSFTFQDSNSSSGASTGMYGLNSLYTTTNAELMYVPKADGSGNVTLTSDPLVAYKSGFNISGFNSYLHQTGLIKYAGQIAPRNAFFSKTVSTIDLHLSQEFPVIKPVKGEAYLDIINLGNMIDPHWGVLEQAGFPYFLQPINAQNCQASYSTVASCLHGNGNYYQFNSFTTKSQSVNSPSGTSNTATWQIKLGLRFKF